MERVDCGVIPVLEEFGRQVAGVISDRDLCLLVLGRGCKTDRVLVMDCMTMHPLYCHSDDDAYRVMATITKYNLRGIVVINRLGELEGLVSTSVLANEFASASKALCIALNRFYEEERQSKVSHI